MQLLVIRHAIAEEREAWARTGRPDAERPLTGRGLRRMRRGVRGLRRLVQRLDVLGTSPLVRARDTAELVARAYRGPAPELVPELAPDSAPDDLLPWLRLQAPDAVAAVVGHEPSLGFLAGWLLTGRHESFVALRKGGACLLEFDDPPAAGGARLGWLLTARQLRALGPR